MNGEEFLRDCSPEPLSFTIAMPNRSQEDAYGKRRIRNYELEFVSTGMGLIELDGRRVSASDHALLLRRPGETAQGHGVYRSRFVEFSYNSRGGRNASLDAVPDAVFPELWRETESRFTRLSREFRDRQDGWQLRCKIELLCLLEQFSCFGGTQQELPQAQRLIHTAGVYMRDHFSEPIRAEQLADMAGYSVYHFYRLFKQETGETPVAYLHRLRIAFAKRRLRETQLSAEAIMLECGFQNYPHFLKVFRSLCGVTPGEYRKLCRRSGGFPEEDGYEIRI